MDYGLKNAVKQNKQHCWHNLLVTNALVFYVTKNNEVKVNHQL